MGLFSFKKKDKNFPFDAKKNMATITCRHIMVDDKQILFASHDADDGGWQFLCGVEHIEADVMIVALNEVYEKDSSIVDISGIPLGCYAERESVEADWQVYRSE